MCNNFDNKYIKHSHQDPHIIYINIYYIILHYLKANAVMTLKPKEHDEKCLSLFQLFPKHSPCQGHTLFFFFFFKPRKNFLEQKSLCCWESKYLPVTVYRQAVPSFSEICCWKILQWEKMDRKCSDIMLLLTPLYCHSGVQIWVGGKTRM